MPVLCAKRRSHFFSPVLLLDLLLLVLSKVSRVLRESAALLSTPGRGYLQCYYIFIIYYYLLDKQNIIEGLGVRSKVGSHARRSSHSF